VPGCCKQQLWPLLHYLLPLSPASTGRFNPELWQAYVKANKARALPFRPTQPFPCS
jgi:trehalose 6-phosphate synthase/phosphatase